MQTVNVAQATQGLEKLIDLTLHGDDVVITRNGQPIVKLVAITPQKRCRQFGSARGLITIADDFDEPLQDFQEYM